MFLKSFVWGQTVQEMMMLSTSVLIIKWTTRGKPKSFIGGVAGDLILRITSKFTLNQISGQVIQHEELWDLSASPASAQAFFWTSRALFATVESVKDLADSAKNFSSNFSTKNENTEIYPDPSGDPTKVSCVLPLQKNSHTHPFSSCVCFTSFRVRLDKQLNRTLMT